MKNMNPEQKHSLIRQVVMSIAALVGSFHLLPTEALDIITPAIIGVGLWFTSPSRSTASAIRKVLQIIAPVLVFYGLINESQSAAIVAVVLSVVSIWTIKEKQ